MPHNSARWSKLGHIVADVKSWSYRYKVKNRVKGTVVSATIW